jgi:hypothetical protein
VRSTEPRLIDLGLDLLVPPLARLGAAAVAGAIAAGAASGLAGRPLSSLWGWLVALLGLGVYVARGCWIAGLGWRGFTALLHLPLYLLWKLRLALARPGRPGHRWVRTERERREDR